MAVSSEALAWAERTRAFREEFVARCGVELDLAAVRAELAAERAALDVTEAMRLGELRLLPVLEAIPAVGGKIASRRLMAAAGLREDVVLGDVDDAAWRRLLAGADRADGAGGTGGTA